MSARLNALGDTLALAAEGRMPVTMLHPALMDIVKVGMCSL